MGQCCYQCWQMRKYCNLPSLLNFSSGNFDIFCCFHTQISFGVWVKTKRKLNTPKHDVLAALQFILEGCWILWDTAGCSSPCWGSGLHPSPALQIPEWQNPGSWAALVETMGVCTSWDWDCPWQVFLLWFTGCKILYCSLGEWGTGTGCLQNLWMPHP